jgi:hypothetical protein
VRNSVAGVGSGLAAAYKGYKSGASGAYHYLLPLAAILACVLIAALLWRVSRRASSRIVGGEVRTIPTIRNVETVKKETKKEVKKGPALAGNLELIEDRLHMWKKFKDNLRSHHAMHPDRKIKGKDHYYWREKADWQISELEKKLAMKKKRHDRRAKHK